MFDEKSSMRIVASATASNELTSTMSVPGTCHTGASSTRRRYRGYGSSITTGSSNRFAERSSLVGTSVIQSPLRSRSCTSGARLRRTSAQDTVLAERAMPSDVRENPISSSRSARRSSWPLVLQRLGLQLREGCVSHLGAQRVRVLAKIEVRESSVVAHEWFLTEDGAQVGLEGLGVVRVAVAIDVEAVEATRRDCGDDRRYRPLAEAA